MPHMDWCGKPCAECTYPCKLDESMPCSPDCELLGEYGYPIDRAKCREVGCDAIIDEIEIMMDEEE